MLAALPGFTALQQQLDALLTNFWVIAGDAQSKITGYTQQLKMVRKTLETTMNRVLAGAVFYYKLQQNEARYALVRFRPAALSRMGKSGLLLYAHQLLELAEEDGAQYYAVTPQDLTDLLLHTEAYEACLLQTELTRSHRKQANARLKPLLDEGFAIRKQIDLLMRTLQFSGHTTIYHHWEHGMRIHKSGGNRRKTEVEVTTESED